MQIIFSNLRFCIRLYFWWAWTLAQNKLIKRYANYLEQEVCARKFQKQICCCEHTGDKPVTRLCMLLNTSSKHRRASEHQKSAAINFRNWRDFFFSSWAFDRISEMPAWSHPMRGCRSRVRRQFSLRTREYKERNCSLLINRWVDQTSFFTTHCLAACATALFVPTRLLGHLQIMHPDECTWCASIVWAGFH
jgi:hypothetical protein